MTDTAARDTETVATDDTVITFDWVRHAESVANWANNKPSDTYTTEELRKQLKVQIQNFQKLEYENVQIMKKSGEFPLINYVYGIIEKDYKNLDKDDDPELIKKCQVPDYANSSPADIWAFGKIDVVNNGCITRLKDFQKEIEAKYKTDKNKIKPELRKKFPYWLRNMITTNFLFQPTLTYVGMQQAINFGTNLKNDKDHLGIHDLVISSPTVRTLMTGYIALMHCEDVVKDKTITIVPYTNEKENDTEIVLYEDGLHDFTNAAIHPDVIGEVCTLIKEYLDNKYSEQDKNITFNTEYYEKFCSGKTEKEIDEIRRCNINKFWDYVKSDGIPIFKGKKNVLSFCHGYAIEEVRQSANVDVSTIYSKTCNSNENNSVKFRSFGANTSIFRHKYDNNKQEVLQNKFTNNKFIDISCNNTEQISEQMKKSLYAIGVVYIPDKIRQNVFIKEDEIKKEEDDLMGLQEGSLRYDIAKITHKPSIIFCKKPGYYKNFMEKKVEWKKLKDKNLGFQLRLKDCDIVKNPEEELEPVSEEIVGQTGGHRTQKRRGKKNKRTHKGRKTHQKKKGRKGRKTRRHH